MNIEVARLGTWIVVAAIGLLGAVAAVDAVRGGEEPRPTAVTRPTTTEAETSDDDPSALAARLLDAQGATGELLVSDDECRVRMLELPSLDNLPPPTGQTCRVGVVPGGDVSTDGVYPGANAIEAACTSQTIRISWPDGRQRDVLGSCPPAWRVDGRLTVVSNGELRDVDLDCSPAIRTCTRTILSQADLLRALGRVPWEMTRPQVRSAAWMSRDRVAVLVRDLDQGLDAIAVFRGRRLVGAPPFLYESLTDVRASPRGRFAAAFLGGQALVAINGDGSYARVPTRGATGITWSPDDRWAAVATEAGLFLFRTDARTLSPIYVPVDAADVAWLGN